MTRSNHILKHVERGMRGVEIGPYFNPLLPKSAGWDVLVLDVFDTARLGENARIDPAIPPEGRDAIEEVDLVGPAHRLADLLVARGGTPGTLDFVVSSHNFEHLPDPIRFLQAAASVLRPGGVLSMAIPDHRFCFDILRPASTAGEMIEAYLEARERPSARQEFESATLFASERREGEETHDFSSLASPDSAGLVVPPEIAPALARWQARLAGTASDYVDAHCWMLDPERLAAILDDLRRLGLCALETVEITPTWALEFYVHLRRPSEGEAAALPVRADAFRAQMDEVLAGRPEALAEPGTGILARAPAKPKPLDAALRWAMRLAGGRQPG